MSERRISVQQTRLIGSRGVPRITPDLRPQDAARNVPGPRVVVPVPTQAKSRRIETY